jgi:hypothetical protein
LYYFEINSVNNEIMANVLPPNLEIIIWNIPSLIELNVLPTKLKTLFLGKHYNQEITPNLLPINLKVLNLSKNYNQEIKIGSLPPNLIDLTIYNDLDIKQECLPTSLRKLCFESQFKIKNNIPNYIEEIKIIFSPYTNTPEETEIIDNIPSSVKKITINNVNRKHFLHKIPFECVVMDDNNNII